MAKFKVVRIVDGDTFDMKPDWKWNGETGSRVRPAGYDAAEIGSPAGQSAKDKLQRLVLNQKVDLGDAYRVDRGRLVCEVFFRERSLTSYLG